VLYRLAMAADCLHVFSSDAGLGQQLADCAGEGPANIDIGFTKQAQWNGFVCAKLQNFLAQLLRIGLAERIYQDWAFSTEVGKDTVDCIHAGA
jgi:hypothetical protein